MDAAQVLRQRITELEHELQVLEKTYGTHDSKVMRHLVYLSGWRDALALVEQR